MDLYVTLCFLLFGTFLFSLPLLHECKEPNDCTFQVNKTKSCPRNQTEWNKRSHDMNCSKTNGYICIPNESFTELLEFCYDHPRILILEGTCLYFSRQCSDVEVYNCRNFEYGCPSINYPSSKIYEYPSCIHVENGCFVAEPSCKSQPPKEENQINVTTLSISLGVSISSFLLFLLLFYFIKKRKFHICKRENDVKNSKKGITCLSRKDTYKESLLDKVLFEHWEEDNKRFFLSRACEEVKNKTAEHNLVIVTGHVGSGKSAIIQHIALNYREDGWIVKPVTDMREIVYAPFIGKKSHNILFVVNDPFGKESFDELSYYEFRRFEEALSSYLKQAKLLISCRKSILSDKRVKRLISDTSNVVDINSDFCKLTEDEKKCILEKYEINEKLLEDCAEIVKIEEYFPLLCKLMYLRKSKDNIRLTFFKERNEILAGEIRRLKETTREQYCALFLIFYFNNNLCIGDILETDNSKKKFEQALALCGMHKWTVSYIIWESLETLIGVLVKKNNNAYQFLNEYIMDVSTFIFGTDNPSIAIKYADISFLRRRVRLETGDDKFTIYLNDKLIDELGERLYFEMFGERLFDVVRNPCLQNKNMKRIFEEKLKKLEKKHMLLEKREPQTDKEKLDQISRELDLHRLNFAQLENKVSCLFALIVFGHTYLSLHCLNILQKTKVNITGCSLLPAVCFNGSVELFEWFLKNKSECLTEKWGGLSPIQIATKFQNSEIRKMLIDNGAVDESSVSDNGQ